MRRTLVYIILLLVVTATAETLVLQPGSEGVDAEVNTDNPDDNNGDAEFLLTDWPVG
ncbi:MAG: hypothetical protein GF399_07380 [Candidatus Coatesbacteria bacterium]|nr:hypothetical protein [Candidatus Coatesbacteria bacterium]